MKFLADDNNSWTLISKENFIPLLRTEDKKNISNLKNKFGKYSLNKLMNYIYKNYPYYAINSKIAKKYLDENTLNETKPSNNNHQVFTIGYEGSSIEGYLNRLIENNVKIVVDVRNNPISMKNGFSKNQLRNTLDKLNIDYLHMPDLGIPSTLRKKYLTAKKKDYKTLFSIYEKTILNSNQLDINKLKKLIKEIKRIALTCFEHDPFYCHRKIVADRIEKQPIHI